MQYKLSGKIGYAKWSGQKDCFGKKIYSYRCKCKHEFYIVGEIIYKVKNKHKNRTRIIRKLICPACKQKAFLSHNNVIFSTLKRRK